MRGAAPGAAAALLALLCAAACTGGAGALEFVQRQGVQLRAGGQPFYFVGANAQVLNEMAPNDPGRVAELFAKSKAAGIRVLRTWAFNHNSPSTPGYGSKRLTWDEREMRGLDLIVQQAAANNIRLILAMGNLWPAYVGPEMFLGAAGQSGDILAFYASPDARALYRQQISFLANRVNTITGVKYRDDPAIMAWDVINEPRCPGCLDDAAKAVHQSWLREMTDYAKGQSPNQLIMLGTEGFFGMDDPHKNMNPGAGSVCEGEDWAHMSQLPSVDVLTTHMYWRMTEGVPSQNWTRMSFSQYASWFEQSLDLHVQLAAAWGKPLIVEEFNILSTRFSDAQRAAIFNLAFNRLADSQAQSGPLAGALVWSVALSGVPDRGYNVNLDLAPTSATASPAPSLVIAPKPGATATPSGPASPSLTTTPSSSSFTTTPSSSSSSSSSPTNNAPPAGRSLKQFAIVGGGGGGYGLNTGGLYGSRGYGGGGYPYGARGGGGGGYRRQYCADRLGGYPPCYFYPGGGFGRRMLGLALPAPAPATLSADGGQRTPHVDGDGVAARVSMGARGLLRALLQVPGAVSAATSNVVPHVAGPATSVALGALHGRGLASPERDHEPEQDAGRSSRSLLAPSRSRGIMCTSFVGLFPSCRSVGKRRALAQIDASQRAPNPTPNPTVTGSANTASYFSSAPGVGIRRIGALGGGSSVAAAGSYSAADTTVIAGVRGTDNTASGSGLGQGSGSGTIGSNRGYTSAPGRRLLATLTSPLLLAVAPHLPRLRAVLQAPTPTASSALTQLTNPDAGVNARGAVSHANPASPASQRGSVVAQSTPGGGGGASTGTVVGAVPGGKRQLQQRASLGSVQPTRGGTSTALQGADRSAGSQQRADVDTGATGVGSGSSGTLGALPANVGVATVNLGSRKRSARVLAQQQQQQQLPPAAAAAAAASASDDELDEFRRRQPRAACAEQQAPSWAFGADLRRADEGQLLAAVAGRGSVQVLVDAAKRVNARSG